MKEQAHPPDVVEAQRPSYQVLAERLQTLLESAGGHIETGFPTFGPTWVTSSYDYSTKTLTLHPWISLKGQVEAMLGSTAKILARKQQSKRGQDAEESRDWLIQDELNRHYGLPTDPHRREDSVPNLYEQAIVDHVIGALEGSSDRGET